MAFLLIGVSALCGLASLVCWILVLIKVFPESIGKGILALICPLYAFIWGWQNKETVGQQVMMGWTIAIIVNIIIRVAAGFLVGG